MPLNPRSLCAGTCRRARVALLVAFGLALWAPAGAQAHAFLISASPLQGARLDAAPRVITLVFSEPVVPASEQISVLRPGGQVVATSRPVLRGAVVREPFPAGLRGVFIVSWRVLADDGHLTAGEFAFAAGSGGPLPASTGTAPRTPPEQVLFSALVFLGLALALGGLASEVSVFGSRLPGTRGAPVALGLVLALLGGVGQLVLVAGQRAGGGFTAGLDLSRLGGATGTRPGALTVVLIGSLLLAAGLVNARRRRWLGIVPLVAAALTISLRGHAGTSGHAWVVGADALHLAAVALWVGMLAHLVLVLRSPTLQPDSPVLGVAVRRYSALALPSVFVILAAGAVDALAELRTPSDLVNTGYGRILLIKGGIVALGLTLALGSRLRALPGNPSVRFGLLRRLTRAEIAMLVAVLAAAAVLVNAAPPRSFARTSSAPFALGPPPVQGPTVQLAALAGLGTVVGVTAAPDELRFRVLQIEDPAPSGTHLSLEATGAGRPADLFPRPCGPGCFELRYRLQRGVTRLRATVAIPKGSVGSAVFEVPWPPRPPQPALLARVVSAMRGVPALVMVERDSSGPHANARPAVFRGDGRRFMALEPWSGGAVNVRPLDRRAPYHRLAFALPGSDIWVRVTIDDRYRLRSEAMVTPAHLIERTFAYPLGAGGSARARRRRGSAGA